MQTARRNADLRTQAELTAVRKLAGCVPHDNGAIDSVQEGFRLLCVLSHDGVGVMTAMRIDMRHGFRKPVDHTRRKDAVEIFRIPVRVLSRFYATIDCADRCRSDAHTSDLQSLMRSSYAVFS